VRNFFGPERRMWPQMRDALHVYVLPAAEFAAALRPAREAIAAFDGCAAVAEPWLHATVTRIPWWRNEIAEELLERLSTALTVMAAATPKFTIPLSGPTVHPASVGMSGENIRAWQSLLEHTRDVAENICGTIRPLPAPPRQPHVTLGYGVAERDSAPLTETLTDLSATVRLKVHALHLVAVHQDPVAGTFTWDELSMHPLA
jgi:2'-5' RNA ligase